MSYFAVSLAIYVLALTSLMSGRAGAVCRDDHPKAVIGESLTLSCNFNPAICSSNEYRWKLREGRTNITLDEVGFDLVVTGNVTSADEVGGKLYECECVDGDLCLLFRITVEPVAHLSFSREVTRAGSVVILTCTAEGYPHNYEFTVTHGGEQILTNPLPSGGNGVYHNITSASKRDSGKYDCTPQIRLSENTGDLLQGNKVSAHLTVYDPPFISCTYNDSVVYSPGTEQTAVLECAVDSTEEWLKVSVNWTTADGRKINEPHTVTTAEKANNNMLYLLLHNVSGNGENLYSCNVFSEFGLEDRKILGVIFPDGVCSSSSPATPGGSHNGSLPGPTADTGDVDCWKCPVTKILLAVILVFGAVIIVLIILSIIFGKNISELSRKYFRLMKVWFTGKITCR